MPPETGPPHGSARGHRARGDGSGDSGDDLREPGEAGRAGEARALDPRSADEARGLDRSGTALRGADPGATLECAPATRPDWAVIADARGAPASVRAPGALAAASTDAIARAIDARASGPPAPERPIRRRAARAVQPPADPEPATLLRDRAPAASGPPPGGPLAAAGLGLPADPATLRRGRAPAASAPQPTDLGALKSAPTQRLALAPRVEAARAASGAGAPGAAPTRAVAPASAPLAPPAARPAPPGPTAAARPAGPPDPAAAPPAWPGARLAAGGPAARAARLPPPTPPPLLLARRAGAALAPAPPAPAAATRAPAPSTGADPAAPAATAPTAPPAPARPASAPPRTSAPPAPTAPPGPRAAPGPEPPTALIPVRPLAPIDPQSPPRPRPAARAPTGAPALRAIVLAPAADRRRWIEAEIARVRAVVQVARSLRGVITALCDDPAPRPAVLVVDLDALTAAEVMQLHEVRERGWFGTIIALGRAVPALRKSLDLGRVLSAPFVEDALAEALAHARSESIRRTVPLPRFPG